MLTLLVSLGLVLAPMGSGNHFGWRNKKGTRTTPVFEQVQTTPSYGGSSESGATSDQPTGLKYVD